MWGTTSFCDELTDDFGGPFEGTSIDNCRLFGRLAGIQSHGVLGLLQQYPPINGHRQPGGARSKPAQRGKLPSLGNWPRFSCAERRCL